jgi:hypothetical protein
VKELGRDLLGLIGFAAIVVGCWLIAPALALIVGGVLLLGGLIVRPF